jgi:hypothetical protein
MKTRITKIILLFILILIKVNTSAQIFNWSTKIEPAGFNAGAVYTRTSVTDKQGNVYTAGAANGWQYLNGVVAFTGGATQTGIVIKHARNGGISWVKGIYPSNASSSCDVKSIAIDTVGNIYLTGNFTGQIDVNPSAANSFITSAGNEDIFVVKWDTSGNYIWKDSIGGSGFDGGESIAVKEDGSQLFITGSFSNTVDFDPGVGTSNLTAAASKDAFILSLNNSGGFEWVKGIFGSGDQTGLSIDITNDGHLYVAGNFNGTTAFASAGALNKTSNGGNDGFVGKYSQAGGNPLWVKQIGGTDDDEMISVKVDTKSSAIYIAGSFRLTVDFDPGIAVSNETSSGYVWPSNATDAYIVKLNTDGDFLWKKIHSNAANLTLANMDVDKDGFVYAVGSFTGTATTSLNVNNLFATSQGWACKLDSLGVLKWSQSIGHQQWDDVTTTISVSDFLDINIGGDYNRGAPNGYTQYVGLGGGDFSTNNGNVSAIHQYKQPKPSFISMYIVPVNSAWNYAYIGYSVNPNGVATSVVFNYGTTLALGTTTTPVSIGAGNSGTSSAQTLTPLQGNTKYYYQLTATNINGSVTSWIDSFTTPMGPVPTITLLDPMFFGPTVVNITSNSASITNCDVIANNLTTTVTIEYGLTTAYGNSVATTPATVTGNSPTSITANLTSLLPGLYHYRIRATNAAGTVYSTDATFVINFPLSINWSSFTAKDMNNQVLLTWETASEKDCDKYEVQKSTNAINFERVANVKAVGNSTKSTIYNYTDASYFKGIMYYRIKQFDTDGKYTYSEVKIINRSAENNVTIYPNPCTMTLSISMHNNLSNSLIEVYSFEGRKVVSEQCQSNNYKLNVDHLIKGTYFLKVSSKEKTFTTKFNKQ